MHIKDYPPFRLACILLVIICMARMICSSNDINEMKGNKSNTLRVNEPNASRNSKQRVLHYCSKIDKLKYFGVCVHGSPCAKIGRKILKRKGSAVDAAIASLICNGLVNMQSAGVGGGFLMTIYKEREKKAFIMDAREVAPAAAQARMFTGTNIGKGGSTIAVPGEIAGYWETHQKFGKLPWAELFYPSIELCENGFNMTKSQYKSLNYNSTKINLDPTLKDIFVDPGTGQLREWKSLIKPKKLCETLRALAEGNATKFYNGSLGQKLVEDIQKRGSIITMKDLNNYRVKWREPITIELNDKIKVYSANGTATSYMLPLMLKILDEFHFTPKDINSIEATIKTYHRMIETYKLAHDWTVVTMYHSAFIQILKSPLQFENFVKYAKQYVNQSTESSSPGRYGVLLDHVEEKKHVSYNAYHGSEHVSVIGQNGDMVSVSSSINNCFGSGVVSERTGILMNSAMDNFGLPGWQNSFDVPAQELNYMEAVKRPQLSMNPTILIDRNNKVKMAIGAGGDSKILTSIAYVIARYLWLDKDLKKALDAPRVHYELFSRTVAYESNVPKDVILGLKKLKHEMVENKKRDSMICVVTKSNRTTHTVKNHHNSCNGR